MQDLHSIYSSPDRAIPQPSGRRPVKPENPRDEAPSIFRTFRTQRARGRKAAYKLPRSGRLNPRGISLVKPKNLPAIGPVNLKNLFHNLFPQPFYTTCGEAATTTLGLKGRQT